MGVGAGPLWVSHNCYMAECSTHENMGRFNSLFVGLFQFASIVGFIVAGLLIDRVSKVVFYVIMGFIGSAGSLIFLLLRKPI